MNITWKRIGIVGGLGPLACAHFYLRLVELTRATSDQEHPEVVVISDPAIPSRLDHLLRHGRTPVPRLISVAERLERAGAELIAMPSITTQAYRTEVARAVTIPVVDMLSAVARSLGRAGVSRPAVVATTATRMLGHLHSSLTAAGISPVYPDEVTQRDTQAIVELVKSGRSGEAAAHLAEILDRPWTATGDGVLIGCTDLSPLVSGADARCYDVSSIFARVILDLATGS